MKFKEFQSTTTKTCKASNMSSCRQSYPESYVTNWEITPFGIKHDYTNSWAARELWDSKFMKFTTGIRRCSGVKTFTDCHPFALLTVSNYSHVSNFIYVLSSFIREWSHAPALSALQEAALGQAGFSTNWLRQTCRLLSAAKEVLGRAGLGHFPAMHCQHTIVRAQTFSLPSFCHRRH